MSANSDGINCASVGACVWDNGPASLQPRVGGPVHAMDLDDRTMGTGSLLDQQTPVSPQAGGFYLDSSRYDYHDRFQDGFHKRWTLIEPPSLVSSRLEVHRHL